MSKIDILHSRKGFNFCIYINEREKTRKFLYISKNLYYFFYHVLHEVKQINYYTETIKQIDRIDRIDRLFAMSGELYRLAFQLTRARFFN